MSRPSDSLLVACLCVLLPAAVTAQEAHPRVATDPTPLTAVVTKVSGSVVITTASSAGDDVHRAQPLQVMPAEAELVAAAGAGLALVCSSDHQVELRGALRWSLTREACARGKPLPVGTYRRLVPRGGRFRVVDGILEIEPLTRPIIEPDPLAPRLLNPRNTRLRDARPRLEWTRVPNASEYEVELVGLARVQRRMEADDCRRAPEWGEGLEVCSVSWPESFPGLEPGRVYFLGIGARTTIVSPLHREPENPKLERCTTVRSAQIEAELAAIESLELGDVARRRVQAALLAEEQLFAEAIKAYRHLVTTEDAGETLVTLGDLYLAIGLDGAAERSYARALTRRDDPIEAAATLGLGLVEAARNHFEPAKAKFRHAAELYRRAGLEEELDVVERLMNETRGELPQDRSKSYR